MSARRQEGVNVVEEEALNKVNYHLRGTNTRGRTSLLIYVVLLLFTNILTSSLTGIGVKDTLINTDTQPEVCSFRCRSSPVIQLELSNVTDLELTAIDGCLRGCWNGTRRI